MSKPAMVRGTDCLQYTNKPIAFVNRYTGIIDTDYTMALDINVDTQGFLTTPIYGIITSDSKIWKWSHNTAKRKIGVVLDVLQDGGYKVLILGDESIDSGQYGNVEYQKFFTQNRYKKELKNEPPTTEWVADKSTFPEYPTYGTVYPQDGGCNFYSVKTLDSLGSETQIPFDDLLDLDSITFPDKYYTRYSITNESFGYNNQVLDSDSCMLDDTQNSLIFGFNVSHYNTNVYMNFCDDPLYGLFGNVYNFYTDISRNFNNATSGSKTYSEWENVKNASGRWCYSSNGVGLVYNLILTTDYSLALRYLQDGALPSDAFLFPLDWNNLPKYTPTDANDDDDDGGNPDDDANPSRDVDPTPVVAPSLLPTMFNANNMYWLGIGEFNTFLTWFWYDIQQFSLLNPTTWDNLFDNIQGLYADLASAIIGVRYYPIDPDWVGGLGSQEVIKIAQVQKDGLVDTISKLNVPPIRNIGSYTVNKDFDSFLDLPPYSELTLYLPYYGYIQLDMDMFNGHSIDVKATYDILSGTITYYIFYDDTFMVNTYTAKMAVDVPITLQTSYDRDRAIQNNISTSLSGFMSAGAGMMSGNPIGMVMGINSLNTSVSPQNTAPIKVEGMTVEQGSLYLPSKCAVILRRPVTTKKGASFAKNNGYLYCKTAKLSDLTGLTIVKNPRIRFNGAEYYNDSGQATGKMLLPLESEIQEIYNLLEGGVII